MVQELRAVLLTPIIFYILFLSIHWIPYKFFFVKRKYLLLNRLLLFLLPLMVPIYFWINQTPNFFQLIDPYCFLITAVFVFILAWCFYVQSYFGFDTSPTLRTLVELIELQPKHPTFEELLKIYNFENTIDSRIERAISGGALLCSKTQTELCVSNSRLGEFWGRLGLKMKHFYRMDNAE